MALRDRVAEVISRAAGRAEALARSIRSPHQTEVASAIPGTTRYTTQHSIPTVERALAGWDALSSRVTPLAGPTRTRWQLWNADDLTPAKIIDAQRQAVISGIPYQWVEMVAQVIERDGHLASVSQQRIADVAKGDWVLHPSSERSPVAVACAKFVASEYRRCPGWMDAVKWLLRSNAYGYAAVENEWCEKVHDFEGPRGERIRFAGIGLRRLHLAHQKHFRFELDTDDPRLWLGGSSATLIPYSKYALMRGSDADTLTIKRGYCWQCIWYSALRQIALSKWGTYTDRYALPYPVLEYDGTLAQYPEYRAAFQQITELAGDGKGVYYPRENMSLEIRDPPRGGETSGPYASLWSALNEATTIRVQAHALVNSTGGPHGSYAQMDRAVDRAFVLAELDAIDLWATIDEQIGAPLLAFNSVALADALRARGYPATPEEIEASIPRGAHHVPGKTDPEKELALAERASKIGLKVSASATMRRAGLEAARSDDDVIRGEAEQVSAGAASVGAVEAAAGVQVPNDAGGAGGHDVAKPQPDNITMAIALTARQQTPKTMTMGGDFKESEHPRGADGEFGPGGGGGKNEEEKADTKKPAEKPAEKPQPKEAAAKAGTQKRKRAPQEHPHGDPFGKIDNRVFDAAKKEAMEYGDGYRYYGLRVIPDLPDDGEELDPSRVWDDGKPTDDYLEGTSALDLDYAEQASIYEGRYVALIGSQNSAGYGADAGEIVLREPQVLEVWTRDGRHFVADEDGKLSLQKETPQ